MISLHQLNTLFSLNMKASMFKYQPVAQLTSYACLNLKRALLSYPSCKFQSIIINDETCLRRQTHTEQNPDSKQSPSSITEVKGASGQVTIGEKGKSFHCQL